MSAEELPLKFRLGYYRSPPLAWPHRRVRSVRDQNEVVTNNYGSIWFYDWIVELVNVPPGELESQRCSEHEFPCLECGIPADDVANSCGETCYRTFKKDMKQIYSRIRIKDSPDGTGQGAFLGQGSFKPPVEGEQSPTEHYVVGMYLGDLLPEVPDEYWKDSAYVVPINGANYEIEERMIPNGFKPRWGGPYRLPKKTRFQTSTVEPAYDTETYTVMIDAQYMGNWTRFINSSCDPNLVISAEQVGKIRVMVFKPLRKIKKGEELTFYYGREFFRSRELQCRCSAYSTPHAPRNIRDNNADAKSEELPPGLREFRGASPTPSPAPTPPRASRQLPPLEPPRNIRKRKREWFDDSDDNNISDDFDFTVSTAAAPKLSRRRLRP